MTLRDYFAAKVAGQAIRQCDDGEGWSCGAAAALAYEMADAMLAERAA
jgi:hypothetical protein